MQLISIYLNLLIGLEGYKLNIFKRVLLMTIFVGLLLIPLSECANAEDEGSIGVENTMSNESKEAFDSLPSDEDLQKQVNQHEESIVDASTNREIKKEKGGLYKAYKKEVDEEADKRKKYDKEGAKQFKDTIEKYNTSTGKIDVGTFDVQGHVINVLISVGASGIQLVNEPLASFTIKPSDVLEAPSAQPLKTAFDTLTDVLIALFLVFQITKIMSTRALDIGYQGHAVYEKLFKTIVAVVLIGLYDPLFKLILNFQYLFITPILKSINVSSDMAHIIMLKSITTGANLGYVIVFPIIAVLILIVTISLFYSLALMIVLYVVGPGAIATMVNDDMEFYSLWIRKIVSRVLTLFLQSLCIALSFATLMRVTFSAKESMTDILLGIAFLIVALGVPKMLENFGDSSGAGRTTIMAFRGMKRK